MNDNIKEYFETGKKNLILVYGLYLGGMLLPMLPIIGATFAFINSNCNNELWRSHYIFAFRTFCLAGIGILTSFVITFLALFNSIMLIGPVLYMFIFVWFIVRTVIALKYLLEGRFHPKPRTLWVK